MSFWSNILNAAAPALKLVPVVGDYLSDALSGSVQEYEQNKQLEKQQGWQKYMSDTQNQFNAEQAQISRDYNAGEVEKARQFDAEQAKLARDTSRQWQLDDWEREIAYNSPANQLKLMQEAGLNPLLFNTSVSNNGMPSSMSPQSPSSPAASSSPASAAGLSGMLSIQNPSLISSEIALKNAQVKNLDQQNEKLKADADKSREEANDLRALRQGKLDMQNVEIHLGLSQERLNDKTVDKMYKECQSIDSNIQLIKQEISNKQQELSNLKLQGDFSQKQIDSYDKELQSRIAVALSESAKNYGLANVSQKQCDLLAEQITGQSIENGLIAIDFSKAFGAQASGSKLAVYLNEHEQSILDFENGTFLKNLWNSNASLPYKVYRSMTGYGAWLTNSISVGLGANANVNNSSYMRKGLK